MKQKQKHTKKEQDLRKIRRREGMEVKDEEKEKENATIFVSYEERMLTLKALWTLFSP